MNIAELVLLRLPQGFESLIKEAGQLAKNHEKQAALVGGCVRDGLLNRPVLDVDLMMEHPAEPVVKSLQDKHQAKLVSHPTFLTFTLHLPDERRLDVTTSRRETYQKPGALPTIEPAPLQEDLKRRDFTINAMAMSVIPDTWGNLIDPFNGYQDLNNKTIRVLHEQSFVDDPTRLFRAARHAGRFGFSIDKSTEALAVQAIKDNRPASLTPVRLRHEWDLILLEKDPLPAIQICQQWGLITYVHTTLASLQMPSYLKDIPSEERLPFLFQHHSKDVFEDYLKDLEYERVRKKKFLETLDTLKRK